MKENEFILLVYKRLSGDITPAEASLLSDWLQQSPDNERMAAEYALIWEKAGQYQPQITPDLKADFAKVQARIQSEEQPALKVLRFNTKIIRAAAAVALLAMAIWGYSTFGSSDNFDALASAQGVEKQLVSLSDGTKVWLREGSSIQYTNSLSNKKERLVKLKGEAFFEVAHDAQHPFKVALENDASVEVLGTSFNIRQSEEGTILIVRTGKVKLTLDGGKQSSILTANQKAVFDRKAGTLRTSTPATFNEMSWQTGGLEFVKTPLSQVVLDLEKYYKVKISLDNPAMADCPHSALLRDQSLQSVLDGLSVAYNLKVTVAASGVYILNGGTCR